MIVQYKTLSSLKYSFELVETPSVLCMKHLDICTLKVIFKTLSQCVLFEPKIPSDSLQKLLQHAKNSEVLAKDQHESARTSHVKGIGTQWSHIKGNDKRPNSIPGNPSMSFGQQGNGQV